MTAIDPVDLIFKILLIGIYTGCMIGIGYMIRFVQEPVGHTFDAERYHVPHGRPLNDNGAAPVNRPPVPPGRPPKAPLT